MSAGTIALIIVIVALVYGSYLAYAVGKLREIDAAPEADTDEQALR